jgi:hypothetical protein
MFFEHAQMKRLISIILFGCSIAGLIYLLYAGGNALWLILVILVAIIAGLILLGSAKTKFADIEKQVDENLQKLKANAEKIKVNYDNCEFKESSYVNEVRDERVYSHGMMNLDQGKVMQRDFVGQSLLIFNYTSAGKTEKFMQAFPFDAESLKFYVLDNLITLYVDRFDRSRYFFDLTVQQK